ncbi:MAG: hypothetical protein IT286_01210 [Proteobacteria bacterium]|nr:hypothetical protein [Pseudomonadota bacterium]
MKDYFDPENIKEFNSGKTETLLRYPKGWGYLGGKVWFNDQGKIVGLHLKTTAFEKTEKEKQAQELKTLHGSISKSESVEIDCKTKTHRVFILSRERHEKFRLVSWKNNTPISESPDINIGEGKAEFQGSGGNGQYIFIAKNLTYIMDVNNLCGEDPEISDLNFDGVCDTSFVITRGEKDELGYPDFSKAKLKEVCE